MSLNTVARTDVGKQRDHNEDSVLAERVDDETGLLAVADGMGGHAAGDVASQLAIDTLREQIVEGTDELPPQSEWTELLDSVIADANAAVNDYADEERSRAGMGTTLVVALVRNRTAVIGNVGDSRAYTVDSDGIEQVTVDQSLVQELVEQGQITEEEAEEHPQQNVISQALGTDEKVEPDFYELTIEDSVLLCPDGLTEEVDDDAIEGFVSRASTLSEASEKLIQRANENGGSDNVSVVLGELPIT